MDKCKALLLAAALVGTSLAAADADAQHRGRHHHHHRGGVGIFFGAPLFYAPYYYPRYYYPPAVVYGAPASPPVYIEQSGAPTAPAQNSSAYWYFCRDTQTYYPYVQQCASPWERVTPQSAPPG